MSAEQLAAAKYIVQKYKRFKAAEAEAARRHVTSSDLETAKRTARHAETMFTCAMEDLCAEFPEEAEDA